MTAHPFADLYDSPEPVTGNTAKVKLLHELHARLAGRPGLRILDVGCVGPKPLELWAPLLDRHSFALTGVDVHGIRAAERIAAERGWGGKITLHRGSVYRLDRIVPPAAFDLLVATQVLEHIARPRVFFAQAARALVPGGEGFLTIDSAHWRARFDPRDPLRLAKNVVKKGLALVGHERHYDLPWYEEEVAGFCREAGLKVLAVRYYNLGGLKRLHNHHTPPERKNAVIRDWFAVEDALNESVLGRDAARRLFMGLYVHFRKA